MEELENALERILDALRDAELSEAERIERAFAIATHALGAVSPRRASRHVSFSG